MRIKNLILPAILLYSMPVYSQKKTDANIIGHVVSGNEHIPFATVSVRGTTFGVTTDETGHFQIIDLPTGKHIVRAQSIGYKPSDKEVDVTAGKTIEIKFDLEPDLLNLEEIVITADKSEIKRVEASSIVNTISSRLFSSTQSVTLSEGLSFTPGLRVENNCQNCGFTQVRMNGLEGPYSQILINSRPIFSGLAGVYGLELIPSNMIEKVEVVRGGGSALYGSNAIAGTINIILKEPSSDIYEVGVNSALTGIGVDGSGGPASDYSVNLNTSMVSANNRTGMSLYGFTRKRGLFDANDDTFSEIAPLSNITIGTRLYHRLGFRSKLSIDFFNISEEREGGNMNDYTLHEREIAESVKHNIMTGALTFEQYLRDYDLLSVYASSQHLDRDSYYGANKSLNSYGSSVEKTSNLGIQYKAVLGKSSVIAGIDYTGGALEDQKLGYPDYANAVIINDSIISVPHTENTTIADQKSTTTGAFLQYDLKIQKLKIGIGGRFDHYKITDYVSTSGNKDGNVFSPRINLMYEIAKPLQARLSYSQGYRAPQIYNEDLHIEVSGSRKVVSINDPDLKQEESHSFMASLDFNRLVGTINTGLLAEAFFTRLSNPFINEIGVPDEDGTVYYTRKNAENGASVKGVNFEFKMKPLGDFSLNAGFTIQKSLFDEAQQFNEKRFFRTPSDYGFLVAEWDFLKSFCLSGSMTYTGRMLVPYYGPLTDPDTGELMESSRFFDMGGKLAQTIKLNGVSLQWFAGIKNIFNSYQSDFDTGINRDPSYIYGPILPRTIYLGLRFGNQILD